MTSTSERMIPRMREFFDALERNDMDGAIAITDRLSHPDCEFTSAIGSEIGGRTYHGSQGLRDWFGELLETVEVSYPEREFHIVDDDILVFLGRMELRGRESGAAVTQEIGIVWKYEDGLFRKGESFTSHPEALAAAEALDA